MMECKMSSAGLWPTLARRCLLSQDDWALSPVRTFSKPKTAPGHRPFPARHTIPFQVWRRFPQAADSATDWQALLRWRRWLAGCRAGRIVLQRAAPPLRGSRDLTMPQPASLGLGSGDSEVPAAGPWSADLSALPLPKSGPGP